MTGFIPSPLFESIRNYLITVKRNEQIFLFVPYIKTKILEQLIEGIQNEVIIITNWDEKNLLSGSSELELYPFCKQNNITLYSHDKIHLKVYSINLDSAIIGSGNISERGLNPDKKYIGNYEIATIVKELSSDDKAYLKKIQDEAREINDELYMQYKEWYDKHPKPEKIKIEKISLILKDDFSIDELPWTGKISDLIQGYDKKSNGLESSENSNTTRCIYRDLKNYEIELGLSKEEFLKKLKKQFWTHPYIQKIKQIIEEEQDRPQFFVIKERIHECCSDDPKPYLDEFVEVTKIIFNWFVELGDKEYGEYEIFTHGNHAESIRRINTEITTESRSSDEYENKILEILNKSGKTVDEIKIIYDQDPNLRMHDEPSDSDEIDNSSKPDWHFKAEMDKKIAEEFSLSEAEIGERNSRGKLYRKIATIMGKLNEEKLIKMWHYEQKGGNYFSDGIWRLTEKGKQEIQSRGISNTNQSSDIQNPISEFDIGKFYHHDDIWKPLDLGWSGGIRTSVKNKLVILFWNAPAEDIQKEKNDEIGRVNIYEDSFDEKTGLYRYIGEGKEGNQTLSRGNKAIEKAKENGRSIHLFHQHERNAKHEYLGQVELVGVPETQTHQDINENDRKEYVFFLKPINKI